MDIALSIPFLWPPSSQEPTAEPGHQASAFIPRQPPPKFQASDACSLSLYVRLLSLHSHYRHLIHTTTASRGAPYSHLYPFITNYPPPVPSRRQGCHYYKSDIKISVIQRIQEDANSKVTPLLKTHHLEILDEYYHKYLDTCLQLGEKTVEIIL